MIRLQMKKHNMILTTTQQKYQNYLSSGRIDKYEYLISEEILPSDQSRIIEQVKFTDPSLGKAFEKQIETTEDQGIKKVEASKALEP